MKKIINRLLNKQNDGYASEFMAKRIIDRSDMTTDIEFFRGELSDSL
ncbi:hypothetical protein [Providencia sneebia]|nr:hypothetical protein [Providencia sneebia]